jgi:hypothetical protein
MICPRNISMPPSVITFDIFFLRRNADCHGTKSARGLISTKATCRAATPIHA